MNRIVLTTACLLIASTLLFAQRATIDTADQRDLVTTIQESVSSPSDQSSDYAPLNNVPFFPGGQQALQTYLNDLNPSNADRQEGTVHIQFRVMPTGHLTEIKVVRSTESMLNKVAMQAVVRMPRWYPAHRSGLAVSSLYVLPITFRSR